MLLEEGNLTVWENDWQGNVGSTKGGDRRTIPMTLRLRAALQDIRHLRGDRVLCGEAGESWTRHMIRAMLRTICSAGVCASPRSTGVN
jgi:hypothetical protein